jgi:hypothetical protein
MKPLRKCLRLIFFKALVLTTKLGRRRAGSRAGWIGCDDLLQFDNIAEGIAAIDGANTRLVTGAL